MSSSPTPRDRDERRCLAALGHITRNRVRAQIGIDPISGNQGPCRGRRRNRSHRGGCVDLVLSVDDDVYKRWWGGWIGSGRRVQGAEDSDPQCDAGEPECSEEED